MRCICLDDELGDLRQRRARKEDAIDAVLLHCRGILGGDGPTAAAKHANMTGTSFLEQADDLLEELDMPAVVAGDADRADVFLNGGADDIPGAAVITEIDHLDAVADEFEVD